jgi:hypothetical protein
MIDYARSSILAKKLEIIKRGKEELRKDKVLRRKLARSSLERPTVSVKVAPPPKEDDEYVHDSEAYKRRESPVSLVNKLVKAGNVINGVKII